VPDQLAIVVKTARREERDYLGEMLHSLKRSSPSLVGLHSLWVSHTEGPVERLWPDGSCQRIDPGPGQRLTLHQNAARCIKWAAGAGATWAMVLEDDLDFCDDFIGSVLRWLHDHARTDRLMYVFGANYAQIALCVRRGETSWDYPVTAFYGAQACAWRTEDAAQLARWLGPDPSYGGVTDHGHDLLLQRWGKERGLTHFLASAPSFVQHIGQASGIGNRYFQFGSWPGRIWSYKGRIV
jgi:hypothetical protein